MTEPKEQPPRHVCGLMGFNPMLGDTCPACDENERQYKLRFSQPLTTTNITTR